MRWNFEEESLDQILWKNYYGFVQQVNPYIYMCRCDNIEFNVFDGN